MKKTNICLLLMFCAVIFSALPASAAEIIESFRSTIAIREDSSLEVKEKLLVNIEHKSIKRGIIRNFPIRYKDKNGRSFDVGFDVEAVKLDGEDIPYNISYDGAYAYVKIGDPGSMIPLGLHTFTIKYTTTRQIGFFENYDELYWNVTGNGWSWPIMTAACSVSLPQKYAGEPFRSIEWYVGGYGERGVKEDAKLADRNTVVTTHPLSPGEGLTVVYTWKKGLISPPPSPFGDERRQSWIAFATLALSCAWFAFAVLKRRSGGEPPAVIPRFYPPKDSSPAFVRYIKEMKVDRVSMTANIIGLAVKGALKIEESDEPPSFFGHKHNIFTLVKKNGSVELTRDEDAMMMRLFPGDRESVTLEQKNARELSNANGGLRRGISSLSRGLVSTNIGLCLTGALIFIAGLATTLPFTGDSLTTTAAAGIFGGAVLMISLSRKVSPDGSFITKIKEIIFSLFPSIVAAFAAYSIFEGERAVLLIVLPFIAAAAVTALMRPFVTSRTERGEELNSEVEGLNLYISVAEKDRLEMLNAPDETPELFERLLPYAMALGAAKTWGDRFAKVLEKAQYTPQWYAGPSPYIFMNTGGFGSFSEAIGSSMAAGMKPEQAPSSFSGAGGGGFSGGGGGGGGGSGW